MRYTTVSVALMTLTLALAATLFATSPRHLTLEAYGLELAQACLHQVTVNTLANASKYPDDPANILYSLRRQIEAIDTSIVPLRQVDPIDFILQQDGSTALANLTMKYTLYKPEATYIDMAYLKLIVVNVERIVSPERLTILTKITLKAEDDRGHPSALGCVEPIRTGAKYLGYGFFELILEGDVDYVKLVDPRGIILKLEV